MRALVLGATGAVGAEVARILAAAGHEVTAAARRPRDGVRALDLATDQGRSALQAEAVRHDVVVNASGAEDPRLATMVGAAGLVDISATGSYLSALEAAAPAGSRIVLGAGLAPGLTTCLVAALPPGTGSEVDVAIMLGGGEQHGAAAVEWTAALAGRAVFAASDGARNLVGWTTLPGPRGSRRYLRADFPDDVLLGRRLGVGIRSHLAVDSRLSTWALALVGRLPCIRGAIARAPHLGSDRWFVAVRERRTGATLTARGRRQSLATAAVAALAAERLADRTAPGCVVVPDLVSLDEVLAAITAAESHRVPSGTGPRP